MNHTSAGLHYLIVSELHIPVKHMEEIVYSTNKERQREGFSWLIFFALNYKFCTTPFIEIESNV
jgi:hypothetical protein